MSASQSKRDRDGKASTLTALIPIRNGDDNGRSRSALIRDVLQDWKTGQSSPMAKVPNIYLCRFYILNDVFYEGGKARDEHLKSRYLVASFEYHGEQAAFLDGLWEYGKDAMAEFGQHCYGFDQVSEKSTFVTLMEKCVVSCLLFFNGSTDKPVQEQLKSLYIKQAFSNFVFRYQPRLQRGELSAEQLQTAFKGFLAATQPNRLEGPTWPPGMELEPPELVATYNKEFV